MCRRSILHMLLTLALPSLPTAAGPFIIREFNTENGLPHNRVNKIYRDSKDFLWICTDDGLSRFDGHQFVNYTTADGLPHMHVNAVLETRGGDYWVSTDGGLSRFDPQPGRKRFTNYAPSQPVDASYINVLAEDGDGSLLLGTNAGLFRFRPRDRSPKFEAIQFSAPSDKAGALKISAITHDAQGRVWLGTEHDMYERQRDGRWTHYGAAQGLPEPFIFTFELSRDGRLWVGFRGGLGRIASEPRPGSPLLDILQTRKSGLICQDVRAIWFGATGGWQAEYVLSLKSGPQLRRSFLVPNCFSPNNMS